LAQSVMQFPPQALFFPISDIARISLSSRFWSVTSRAVA
jgi:hypothetical protein